MKPRFHKEEAMDKVFYLFHIVFVFITTTIYGNELASATQYTLFLTLILWFSFILGALSEIFRKK